MRITANARKLIIGSILIFVIALFVRTWKLSSYPVHMSIDEVAFGYNANSILTTGKDEWGKAFPLAFESVGDFKPPVNVYLTSLSIWAFGLDKLAVRLPSATTGAATAVAVILLLRTLGVSLTGSLFGGLWLALSAWHIHFSRGGFESITGLFLVIAGTALFLAWGQKKRLPLLLGAGIALSLSVWSYYSQRLFVPILFIFLFLTLRKGINFKDKEIRRQIVWFALVVAIFALPFLYLTFFTPAVMARAKMTFMLSEISLTEGEVVKNIFLILRHWVGKYLNYFDLRFWFAKGLYFTPPGYPDLGLLYLADLPFLFLGIYSLIVSKNKQLKAVSLFWFLTGPLAASLTRDEQHPLRAILWLPFFAITTACGFEYFVKNFKRVRLGLAVYATALVINFTYFFDIYTVQFPYFFSEPWQYGYEQIAQFACANRQKYDDIFISESFGAIEHFTGVPQIYLAFYCGGKPIDYISRDPKDGIYIKRPLWESDSKKYKNTLFIAAPWDFPIEKVPEKQIVKRLNFLNGKLGFIFVEVKN